MLVAIIGLINYYVVDKKIAFKFFSYGDPNFHILSIITFLLVLKAVFILPHRLDQPSDFGAWIIFLSTIMPIQIYGSINTTEPISFLQACIWLEMSFLALVCLTRTVRIEFSLNLNIPPFFLKSIVYGGLIFFCVQIYSILELGLVDAIFDLNALTSNINIYERRLEARIYFENRVALGYFYAFGLTTLYPFCLLLSMQSKKLWLVPIPLLGYCFMFVIDGSRSMGLIFLILIFFYFLTAYIPKKLIINCLLISILLVFSFSIVIASFYDSYTVQKLISRIYYARGLTFSVYFDTFLFNPNYLYSMDFGNFVPRLNIEKSFFIGLVKGDGISENWVGGVWPSFFANLGNGGLLLAGLLIAATLKIFDSVTTFIPHSITFPVIGLICYTWGDISFETSLLTHGVLGLIFLSMLVNERFKSSNENQVIS